MQQRAPERIRPSVGLHGRALEKADLDQVVDSPSVLFVVSREGLEHLEDGDRVQAVLAIVGPRRLVEVVVGAVALEEADEGARQLAFRRDDRTARALIDLPVDGHLRAQAVDGRGDALQLKVLLGEVGPYEHAVARRPLERDDLILRDLLTCNAPEGVGMSASAHVPPGG